MTHYTILPKEFSVLLLGIIFSPLVSAGFIPEEWEDEDDGIFQVLVEGQYFYQANNLALVELTPPGPGMFILLRAPNPESEWGYRVGLGYIFPSHDYDLRANYWQVRADNNNHFMQDVGNVHLNSPQKSHYDFQAADFTLGQYFDPCDCFDLRIGYGVAYAKIDQHADTQIAATVGDAPVAAVQDSFKNKFEGIGPKLSLDGIWDLNHSFSLVGGIGASLLFGESKAIYDANTTLVPTPPHVEEEDHKAVFAADAKAGVDYTQVFNEHFALVAEAGYRGAYYFDAVQEMETTIIPAPDTTLMINTTEDNDYYNYGPYVNLTINFM